MRIKIFNISILEYIAFNCIITLFIWISFFPNPLQQKYHLVTNMFLAIAFLSVLVRKRAPYIFKLNDYPLWFFLIAIGINVLFSQQKNIALKTYLNLAIPMFFIYYLISQGFTSEFYFNLLAKTICIIGIAVSLLAVFEILFAFNPIYKYFIYNPYYERYTSGFVRPMSTQFNPAPLGSYLLGCLPFNFLFFKERDFLKLLAITGAMLNAAVIILTFARGSLFGFAVLIIFYLFMRKSYRLIPIFLLILFIAMFACEYLPYPISKFGISATIGGDGMLSKYRLSRNTMTMNIIKDHPLVGLGFQHFRTRFYEYYPYNESIPYEKRIPDNMFLAILSEMGIIGFLGFLLFLFSMFKRALKGLTKFKSTSFKEQPLFFFLLAFVGVMASMVGYELLYWPNQYIHFCILAGCINAYCRNITKQEALRKL